MRKEQISDALNLLEDAVLEETDRLRNREGKGLDTEGREESNREDSSMSNWVFSSFLSSESMMPLFLAIFREPISLVALAYRTFMPALHASYPRAVAR